MWSVSSPGRSGPQRLGAAPLRDRTLHRSAFGYINREDALIAPAEPGAMSARSATPQTEPLQEPLTECVVCSVAGSFTARSQGVLESPYAAKDGTGGSWGGSPGLGRVVELALSRALVGSNGGASAAVVVLGYRNPQATATLINRWRVRAGIRSIAADGAHGACVIFSGGATSSGAAEAQLMADYATSVLDFDGTVLLEDQSTTTWENIANVIPLLEEVDRIKIASQSAHALRARAYLRRQRPDLAERLVRADDCRPGEWVVVKPCWLCTDFGRSAASRPTSGRSRCGQPLSLGLTHGGS
ncbi:YdcF family protein [Streptomyces sp. NPDC087894]|uniref:YdcF family protein n=1 Tax=Streptomyces sp. NPDC087894 TaxID=3365816 RepID=UPI00381EC3E4